MQPKIRNPHARWQHWLGLLAICVLAATGLVLSLDMGSYLFRGNLHPVIPGAIYRSAQPTPERLERWIESLSLRSVINLKGPSETESRKAEADIAQRTGIELRHLRLSAQRLPSPAEAEALVQYLDTLPRPLLIHCHAGTDRSGLAAAIAVLLEGGDLDLARGQFRLRYGYPGTALGSDLPEFLASYGSWLKSRTTGHTPDTFRNWLRHDYIAYYYRASLDFEALPSSVALNQPFGFEIEVTNRSRSPIPMRCEERAGVRLSLVLWRLPNADKNDAQEMHSRRRYCVAPSGLGPGESLRIASAQYNLTQPGHYAFEADLVDEKREHFFADMGSRISRRTFVVE